MAALLPNWDTPLKWRGGTVRLGKFCGGGNNAHTVLHTVKGVNAATLAAWIRDAQSATCLLGVGYAERRNIVVIHRGLPRVFRRARVKISGRNGMSNCSRAHPCVSKRLPRTVKTWRAVGQSCWAGCSKTRKRGTEFFKVRSFVGSQDNTLCRVIVALFAVYVLAA